MQSTLHFRKTKPHNMRSYGSSKRSLMKIASASPSSSGLSSMTNHTRVAEVRTDELEKCTDRLSEAGSQNNPSAVSLEQARTSWQ